MARILLLFAAFILFAGNVQGQDVFGSPYTYYGMGEFAQKGSGINTARGGTGIGSRPWYDVNLKNPAAYTSPILPSNYVFLADYTFSVLDFNYRDEQYLSSQSAISNLAMWVRPRHDLAMVVGMSPYSKMGYSIEEVKNLAGYGKYTILHKGSGGVNRYYAGLGYTAWKRLSLGANLSYLFGSLRRQTEVQLQELDAAYARERLSLGAFTFDVGAQYSQKFGKNNFVTVGTTIAKGQKMATVQTNQIINRADQTVLAEWETRPENYVTPDEYGVGVEVALADKLSISADFTYRNFNGAYLGDNVSMIDTRRVSGGVDWMPNPASQSYFGRMVVRAGGFYETQPWDITSSQFVGHGITGGLSFPLTNYFSRLNVGFEWKKRGTAVSGRESSYSVSVGFTLHDKWFQKRVYE